MTAQLFTGRMSFLSPNKQYQSTKGKEKAPTATSGLASSFLHLPLDSWWNGCCCIYATSCPTKFCPHAITTDTSLHKYESIL